MEKVTAPQPEVFTIHGAEPEVLAYGLAKYSRSAAPLRETLREINSDRAGKFLDTFYFSYGHRSIADLAHVPMALEGISMLAAIEVVDEQRWDGQERSTRYQDFSQRLYYTPPDLDELEAVHYHRSMNDLFDAYDQMFAVTLEQFREQYPRPEEMKEDQYERTLRARSFDVARYLLPMGTLTSVGQITNARTLEEQISRMMGSRYREVRDLAEKMKQAAGQAAFNLSHERLEEAIDEVSGSLTDTQTFNLKAAALSPVFAAPTLVKYTARREFDDNVAAYIAGLHVHLAWLNRNRNSLSFDPLVSHIRTSSEDAEVEILATVLYQHTQLPYSYLFNCVGDMKPSERGALLGDILASRGSHDDLPTSFRAATGITFDIYMDIGGMRDMHRHRRCTQIAQDYTADHFATPEPMIPKVCDLYMAAIQKVKKAYDIMKYLRQQRGVEAGPESYLLPLGAKRRFLMKMDVAEMMYIAELRTGPAGHISYRRVAWEIYRALRKVAPTLANYARVTDPDFPLDFFKR